MILVRGSIRKDDITIMEKKNNVVTEKVVTPLFGVVANCNSLCIRTSPSLTSDIAGILGKGTTVEISREESTEDFYRIVTEFGGVGYCMKKYIALNEVK